MTVAATPRLAGPYECTGGETLLSYAFRILSDTDIAVWRNRGAGQERLLLGVHYSVQGVGNAGGGSVTLLSAALAGDRYVIEGARPRVRTSDLVYAKSMPPATVNGELDSLQIQIREIADKVERAVTRSRFVVSAEGLDLPEEPGYLAIDDDGAIVTKPGTGTGGGGSLPSLPLTVENGGTGADDPAEARDNLGLGDLATKDITAFDDIGRGLVRFVVETRALSAPPASPQIGQAWLMGPVPLAGDWEFWTANKDIGVWNGTTWVRHQPLTGWTVEVADEGRFGHFSDGAWQFFFHTSEVGVGGAQKSADLSYFQFSGTAGGVANSSGWYTYPINTIDRSTIPGLLLDVPSHVFALLKGTYRLRAHVEFFYASPFRLRLLNVTTGQAIYGPIAYAPAFATTPAVAQGGVATLDDLVEVTATSEAFVIQFYCTTSGGGSNGLGQPQSVPGVLERYGKFVIEDQAALQGVKGDKGLKGDTGPIGPAGITVPTPSGLSLHTDWDPATDQLFSYDVSTDAMKRLSVSGDLKLGPGIRLRDPVAAVTAGGLHRLTMNGAGAAFYQINTAAGGDFGTALNVFSVAPTGATSWHQKLGVVTDHVVSGTGSGGATQSDVAFWVGTPSQMTGSSTIFNVPFAAINVAETVTNDFYNGATYGYNPGVCGLYLNVATMPGAGKGNRNGLFVDLSHNADTGATGTAIDNYKFRTAIFGRMTASVNDGGTLANPRGAFFAGGYICSLHTPSTGTSYYYAACGIEADCEVQDGVWISEKIGFQAVLINADWVQGATVDGAFVIAADGLGPSYGLGHHPGWLNGFMVGKNGSHWPIDPNHGTLFGVDQSGTMSGTIQAKYGIDLNGLAIVSGGLMVRANGWTVTGDGAHSMTGAVVAYGGFGLRDVDASAALVVVPSTNYGVTNRTLSLKTGDLDQELDIESLNGAWTPWTIASGDVTSGSGALSTSFRTGFYRKVGKTVTYRISITPNAAGTTSINVANLPFAAKSTQSIYGNNSTNATTGMCYGQIPTGSTTITIRTYANAYPAASGETVHLEGTIEIT